MHFETFLKLKQRVTNWENMFELEFRTSMTGRTLAGGDLQQRHGFSCLFITHALSVVRRIAHRVAVMKDGRIVETAETEELFARPRHDYTRALLAAAPVLEPAAGGGWRLAGPANDRSAL